MSATEKPLHIDIPVTLNGVKTVYSIGALTFEGDLPASIFHLQLITNDIARSNAEFGGYRRLSHECRPRDAARYRLQCRSKHRDRQSL